jgi:hypothetical protein
MRGCVQAVSVSRSVCVIADTQHPESKEEFTALLCRLGQQAGGLRTLPPPPLRFPSSEGGF